MKNIKHSYHGAPNTSSHFQKHAARIAQQQETHHSRPRKYKRKSSCSSIPYWHTLTPQQKIMVATVAILGSGIALYYCAPFFVELFEQSRKTGTLKITPPQSITVSQSKATLFSPLALAQTDGTSSENSAEIFTFSRKNSTEILAKVCIDPTLSKYWASEEAYKEQASRLAKFIETISKKFPEGNYIDFVLNHPEFKIYIVKSHTKSNGAYHASENAISIDFSLIDTPAGERSIMGLFHSAYKPLIHNTYQRVTKEKIDAIYSYDVRNTGVKPELTVAIEAGDKRIISEAAILLYKREHNILSAKEYHKLEIYEQACSEYIPRYLIGHLPATTAAEIKSKIDIALAQGNVYQHAYLNDYSIYIDRYELMDDGSIIIHGYSTHEPHKNKLAALIGDTAYRKIFLDYSFKKHSTETDFFDSVTMHDVSIAEGGPKVTDVFYPERQKFHEGEYHEFLTEQQRKPSMRLSR
jgi:hypothetical protein